MNRGTFFIFTMIYFRQLFTFLPVQSGARRANYVKPGGVVGAPGSHFHGTG